MTTENEVKTALRGAELDDPEKSEVEQYVAAHPWKKLVAETWVTIAIELQQDGTKVPAQAKLIDQKVDSVHFLDGSVVKWAKRRDGAARFMDSIKPRPLPTPTRPPTPACIPEKKNGWIKRWGPFGAIVATVIILIIAVGFAARRSSGATNTSGTNAASEKSDRTPVLSYDTQSDNSTSDKKPSADGKTITVKGDTSNASSLSSSKRKDYDGDDAGVIGPDPDNRGPRQLTFDSHCIRNGETLQFTAHAENDTDAAITSVLEIITVVDDLGNTLDAHLVSSNRIRLLPGVPVTIEYEATEPHSTAKEVNLEIHMRWKGSEPPVSFVFNGISIQ